MGIIVGYYYYIVKHPLLAHPSIKTDFHPITNQREIISFMDKVVNKSYLECVDYC
jgi:hypothetical protein